MEKPKTDYDIIVIGSGPAGSMAAKEAAEKGYSVCVLEKDVIGDYGRYKACGGALAWEIVEELKYPLEKIERVIESLELHHTSGNIYSKKGKGAVVWRSTFDQFLNNQAQQSGAILKDNEPLLNISPVLDESSNAIAKEDSHYLISTTNDQYLAKYVIAADGVYSPTLQKLNWPTFAPEDLVMTITQEMKSTPEKISETLGSDCVHLFFGIRDLIPLGYAWLFPKSDTISVGWGNNLNTTKNWKTQIGKFMNLPLVQNAIQDCENVLFKTHLIPVGIRPIFYKEKVFATGDSGGFVDPISGKGIPYALMSGKCAIESIHKAEQKGKQDQLGTIYEHQLNTAFLSVLKKKKELRAKIFTDDDSLIKFLDLWQYHHSSEIIVKNLF